LGAHLAGTAIENSMLGAAHATANPLTAHYPLSHGRAIALMLPHVIRLNGQVADDLYGELCADIQLNGSALALAEHLEELCAIAGLPRRLADCQITASDLPAMAQEAADQWTGTFNPLPLQEADFLRLYEVAF
ncbi:MAG: iron-containing alcohol dehydrogenase, partial [Gemmatimonadetes bacterium]|nr:iron-containing alcohol dehydrogenase [Gemmatimonadota bacterium]